MTAMTTIFEYQIAGRNKRPLWQFWVPKNVIAGEILAANRQQAVDLLRARKNVTIYDVTPSTTRVAIWRKIFRRGVPLRLIQGIINSYALYHVEGNLPESDTIEAIARSAQVVANPRVHQVMLTIEQLLRTSRAGSFGDACRLFPDVFPTYIGAIIAAGARKNVLREVTADLEEQLVKRVQMRDTQRRVVRNIRGLATPLAVMWAMLIFVLIPAMTSWNGADVRPSGLPWFLALPVIFAKIISSPFFLLLMPVVLGGGFVWLRWYIATPRGRRWWDERILAFGLYGQAVALMEQGDFFLTYARLDNAGTETNEAWALAAQTSSNVVMRRAFDDARGRLFVPLWRAFRDTGRIDTRATDIIQAAEYAGGRNLPIRLASIGHAFMRESLDLFQRASESLARGAAILTTLTIILIMVTAVLLAVANLVSRH